MEKFCSSKTFLKMAGGRMHTQHTPHPPWLYNKKDGLKFKGDAVHQWSLTFPLASTLLESPTNSRTPI